MATTQPESLINTLDSPSEFDAAAKLRKDEPYFLLIGRDRLAPQRVQDWARENRMRAMDEWDRELITEEQRDAELEKSLDAERIAWSMQTYKRGWQKRGEVPKPAPAATYTGHQLPEETIRRDAEQRLRTRTRTHLTNAAGELGADAAEFRTLGLTTEADALDAKVANLRHMANLISPPPRVLANRQEDSE